MTKPEAVLASLQLTALDGSNPLGFLAALGTLVVARRAGESVSALRWERGLSWTPVLDGLTTGDPGRFSDLIADALRGTPVSDEAKEARAEAQRAFDEAKKRVKERRKTVKGLRGAEREAKIRPLERRRDELRERWLQALARAVPRSELALGMHIDCTGDELRAHVRASLSGGDLGSREPLDLLAAFASDACTENGRVKATPFCFVTGSGRQYFLDTVRQLMEAVEPVRVQRALFERWTYQDESLSLRWDPVEDRRYALMDIDPTAHGNEPRTVWMANLLAYRALALFPVAPRRGGLAATAWRNEDEPVLTWPIWEFPAGPETVRSLLQLREFTESIPDRSILRARGVAAMFRARRIKVGEGANSKLNFSPARAL